MEILQASNLMNRAESVGERAKLAQLYPSGAEGHGLLAVDLLEIEAGGSTGLLDHAEDHLLFVVAGSGEIRGVGDTIVALLAPDTVVHVGPREGHMLKNTGPGMLRVLVSTPLLVRSERSLGRYTETAQPHQDTGASTKMASGARLAEERGPALSPAAEAPRREGSPTTQSDRRATASPSQHAGREEDNVALPDISAIMKRGSDVAAGAKPDRRRSQVQPEPAPEPERAHLEATDEEDEDTHRELMELAVVFDGGSRGNPGQGYGSYLVQSPGRKPVIKRVELGDNYTSNQAEYDSLLACLQYIIERLTLTNRVPDQVALDIKSDSDVVVNQLQGNYKVKDDSLKQRHAQAFDLLGQFGEWMITWHPREESVRLLGH